MAEKYSYGLLTAKVGTTDVATGLGTGLADMGSIFKDTMELMESDIAQTPLFAQQDPNTPKLVLHGGSQETVKLSLMDTSADTLAKYCGGTVTTVATVKTWNKPLVAPNLEMAFEFVTTDGAKIEIPRGSVAAKKNFKVADNSIWVLELTITPLASKVAGVKSLRISDIATA